MSRRCRSRACARARGSFACFSAASVSAVSPDCETTTTSAVGIGDAVAIAVFACDLDGARNARERLDPLLRDERRVIARSARQHEHVSDAGTARASASSPNSDGSTPATDSSVSATARGCSKISFCMKWRIGAKLDGRARRLDRDHGPVDALAARVVDRPGFAAHVGDVAVLEIGDAARDRQKRRRVGGEEMVVGADADDERASRARADDAARFARGDHGDRVRPVELGDRPLHRVAADRRRPRRASARGRDAR